ncbi:hypothetical protein BUALT_Bualt03G0083600 [Buddleja alternifolia]|uniref:DUF506 family protein n=1 Tax=Buddleja alternifolia TaxID=168488 RepID=A0AAV6XS15_9LAMI|nr:hypothetical protein BUALT_Bualt03G0083600 [Buddleja alternifolia]
MVNIPVKFKRTAAAFDEVVRVRSCESSGSEHSAADLSDLVNSFLEREINEERRSTEEIDLDIDAESEINDESEGNNSADFELQDSLKNLFDRKNDGVKRSIHAEVEKALREEIGDKNSSPEFNRRLMARLRNRGFDAGLCKSKWEKNGRNPSGNYEYIDVNANGNRYIIEVFLAGEFTIARPTICYASLLDIFPPVFVGKPDELRQVTRLMCSAIRKSMKRVDLNVPPWRRLAYMQAKWFGSYKRTTNEIPSRNVGGRELIGNKFVGFAPVPGVSFYCREDFAAKAGGRIGNLAAAFNEKEMLP